MISKYCKLKSYTSNIDYYAGVFPRFFLFLWVAAGLINGRVKELSEDIKIRLMDKGVTETSKQTEH